jgi:hypothetical protein
MFLDSSNGIEEYTTLVTGFINKCIDDVIPTVTVHTYPNQKPWITSNIFTDIFNLSLAESVIPTCFKQTTIVTVSKIAKVTCLNDSRPVALTSVAMKCFERLVMAHINPIITGTLEPLQFAYHPYRSTDDAISITLHTALNHLDKMNTYVRMLFIVHCSQA